MTLAWYGHLKFKDMEWSKSLGLLSIIAISWGIALFEYIFQVPANKYGFKENGGPFSLMQLKVTQEAISISVFLFFLCYFLKPRRLLGIIIVAFTLLFWLYFLHSLRNKFPFSIISYLNNYFAQRLIRISMLYMKYNSVTKYFILFFSFDDTCTYFCKRYSKYWGALCSELSKIFLFIWEPKLVYSQRIKMA